MKIFIMIAMLILILAGCSNIYTPTTEELINCTNDSDCILVSENKGCCDCNLLSINKEYTDYWFKVHPDKCDWEKVQCAECVPDYEARCYNRKCEKVTVEILK